MTRVSKFLRNDFHLLKISGSKIIALVWICITMTIGVVLRWQEILNPSLVDWDENTFLTVASESLRGHLPYTTTIENKPPLALVFQTVALFISNHDLVILRLICSILVSITGILLGLSVFQLTKHGNWYLVLLSSTIYSFAVSSIPSGLSWGTEINTNFIFALLLLSLTSFIRSSDSKHFYSSAFLLGLLPNFRTNWLPISILCFGYLLFLGKNKSQKIVASCLALAPTTLIITLYSVKGLGGELYKYALEMPLFVNFVSVPENRFSRPQGLDEYMLISLFFSCFSYFVSRSQEIRNFLKLLFVLFLIQYIVLTLQSPNYAHHTIQLVPFFCFYVNIVFVQATEKLSFLKKSLFFLSPLLFISVILLTKSSILGDYENNEGVTFVEMQQTSKWVKSFKQERVWALNSHYIFWMNGLTPPEPYLTHPSHIFVPGFVEFIQEESRPISEYIENIVASNVGVFYLNANAENRNSNLELLQAILLKDGYLENVKYFDGNKYSFWKK
jgi:hypothetical protein